MDSQDQSPSLFVYAIAPVENPGPVKIGRSKNVAQRLITLQGSSPYRLAIRWQHETSDVQLEQKLHRHFRSLRLSGEWFDFTGVDWLPLLTTAAAELEHSSAPAAEAVSTSSETDVSWRDHQIHDGSPLWSMDITEGTAPRCASCGHKAALHGKKFPHGCGNVIPGFGCNYLCECPGFRSKAGWEPTKWAREAATCAVCCEQLVQSATGGEA